MFANILQQEQTSFGLNTASPLMRGKAHVSQALQLKTLFSQVLQMCWAFDQASSFTYTHTRIHAQTYGAVFNMPLNGTTKYSPSVSQIMRMEELCAASASHW